MWCIIFILINTKSLVRIYGIPTDVDIRELDIAGAKRGEWFDVVISEDEFYKLSGRRYSILIEDVEAYQKEVSKGYHTFQEFVDSLIKIANNHPSIANLDTIGWSWENRPILAMKISDNVNIDENEPELLFMGLYHAREWPTLEICLFYADTFTRAYGRDNTITNIVNTREIYLIPCVNPDGYVYSREEGHNWRKNRRYFPEFGTYGVDLNRNHDGACNENIAGAWGSLGDAGRSTSHNPNSWVYCGDAPASEKEIQAIQQFVASRPDIIFSISYHTYGEMVLWPWGYTDTPTPDASIFESVGYEMARRIQKQGGGTYDAYQSVYLYPTTGDNNNWLYGYSLEILGKNHFPFVIETCTTFAPPANQLPQVLRANFNGILYLCDIAEYIRNTAVPRIISPVIKEMDTSITSEYTVNWTNRKAERYELQELSHLTIIKDSAETDNDLWIMENFRRRSARSYSGSYSYYSTRPIREVTGMTTKLPIPKTDSLSFWCWYNIEENYEYAFVEVSPDKRQWVLLDAFTGRSNGWIRKSYALPNYKSFFIRFRYTTEGETTREGFYVDDIYPVAKFDSITTIPNITDTFYNITGKDNGTYWYRVRGHNQKGWGAYSQLEDIFVKKPGICEKTTSIIETNIKTMHYKTINIEYQVNKECDVNIKIYNIMGSVVYSNLNKIVSPGKYNLTIKLNSGVYFVIFNSDNFYKKEKIILFR